MSVSPAPSPPAADQTTLRRRGVGLTALDAARSAGGYTLFAPQTGGGAVYLVDIRGEVVHRWQMPVRPGRDAVILPNGHLGYNGSHPDPFRPYPAWPLWRGGDFYEATPEGKIVWRFEDPRHHHDARWLDNGDLLYATVEPLSAELSARVAGGDPRRDAPDGIVQGDVIRQVNRQGETVWRWAAGDHLPPEDYPVHPIFDRRHWPFVNGLGETRDGLVLMSLRVTSGIIAVDRDTGAVAWRIGADRLAQQHTPIEMADGSILCFDNGNLRPGVTAPFSRAVQVDPGTGRTVWEYADPLKPAFFSPYMGSAQRLWNGNTFICESAFGRLFEVTPEGDVVWEYVIPFFGEYPDDGARDFAAGVQNSVFRAHRYEAAQIPWLRP
ncbi:aryl sulfotransferase [Aureimonas flava]|uniref:Aryl sulfotransferase n=1 Tax=Aureimonas flava TaxID=2320271 RepID=A0A3A1WNX8_9HYPH|nr:aryl-sulfate sulfotransferase [Aureimonas flava]RIY02492.1 aryl sulfotransferase [Aureimonas flava]